MPKTLIVNLGQAGLPQAAQAGLTRLEIDGVAAQGVHAMTVVIDASTGQPAHFCLHRVILLDGLEYLAEEVHHVMNMSMIIEYQEEQ